MNRQYRTQASFYLLFLLLTTVSILAQQSDVRLSREPLSMILPDDAKVQSAARQGNITLAVWGTTYLGTDSSVVNTLVFQVMQGAQKIGTARPAISPSARPFGYVQVLALAEHFVVVWNDNRNGDTVAYMQRIATSGNPIGNEELFSSSEIMPFGIVQIQTLTGYRWIWSSGNPADSLISTESTTYLRSLDAAGNFIGQVQGPLGGIVHEAYMPNLLPGITLLHRGNLPPLLIDSTGAIDSLHGEAARHFLMPYYLDEDGSIVTLEDRTIRFFHTLLDTIPYKSLTAPIPTGILEGSQSITRSSLGSVNIIWATGGPGIYDGGSLDYTSYTYVVRMELTPGDTFSPPVTMAKIFVVQAWSHINTVWVNYKGSRHVHGCNNSYRTELTFFGQAAWHFDSQTIDVEDYTRIVPFIVHGDGSIEWDTRDPRYDGSDRVTIQPPIPDLPLACGNISHIVPQRIASKSMSLIRLKLDTSEIELSTQTAAKYLNVPQFQPGITVQQQQLLVAWQSTGLDTLYELGLWNTKFQDSIAALPPLEFNQIPEVSTGVEVHQGIDTLINRPDCLLLSSIHNWNQRENDSLLKHRQFNLYLPNQSGWIHGKTTDVPSNGKSISYKQFLSYSFDPDDQQLVGIRQQLVEPSRLALWAFSVGKDGNERWEIDSMLVLSVTREDSFRPVTLIALGGKKSLSIYNGVATRHNGVAIDSVFVLPAGQNPNGLWPSYARILGPNILRWHTNDHLLLDILRFDGTIVAAQTKLLFPQGSVGYHITQNPSDSGFAILFGGKEGSITLLDKQLNILQTNIPLSSAGKDVRKPVGVFRNDTLFAVWEDYRNGVPDIYGTYMNLHTSLSAQTHDFPADQDWIDAITPNPANELATVTLSTTDARTLTVVDSYGAIRMRVEVANHRAVIDTRTLPTGIYQLILSEKETISSNRMIVIH